jgi:hypothetical protein
MGLPLDSKTVSRDVIHLEQHSIAQIFVPHGYLNLLGFSRYSDLY